MKNMRRSPEQTRAAQKQRDAMQQVKDEEMSRKMREAYERTQRQSTSGMSKGGVVLVIESESPEMEDDDMEEMSKGGMSYAKGGMTRGGRDGCAVRGKTKGRMV